MTLFLHLEASEIRRIKKNVPLTEGNFLLLDDLSCYIIYPVRKTPHSLSQLVLGNEILQPEEKFLFSHNEWEKGKTIAVHDFCWEVDRKEEMDKYNQPKLALCYFLLTNIPNTQAAFGEKITFGQAVDLFVEYANFRFEEGKKKSTNTGLVVGGVK